jgi:diguanylate cyclase (GGDEF)-like protein
MMQGISSKRATIGFFCANIHIGVSSALWQGIVHTAREKDANLFCFPGGGLGVQSGNEVQRNLIYELGNSHCLDGVISWATTLGVEMPKDDLEDFHRRFHLPIVTLGMPLDGFSGVITDDAGAIRSAIAHLVEVHHLRRLAMIRGPENHFSANQRYLAYLDVMRENGIDIDPRWVTPPLYWEDFNQAAKILLDERGLIPGVDFDGVISASDLFAIPFMKALQERNIPVPGKVAVIGFNNLLESHLVSPPLTSVEPNFFTQGCQAVKVLLEAIQSGFTPGVTHPPAALQIRQSCGCPPQSVIEAAMGAQMVAQHAYPLGSAPWREQIRGELERQFRGGQDMDDLLSSFEHALRTGDPWDFLTRFATILRQADAGDEDLTAWQAVVSTIRRNTLMGVAPTARVTCEDLCGQARVIIGEMAQRAQAYRQLQAERQSEALREIGQALITSFDMERLSEVLVERLPQLGISSCFMALYDDKAEPLDQSRLVMAFAENKQVPLPPEGVLFPTRHLIPERMLPDRRFSFIVEPLFFQKEPIGFALFEAGPLDGAVYEVLRAQISSALKGASLFREVQEQKRQLTVSEAQLKELSIRDPLTGLYNRRFLEETLEREIHKCERAKAPLGILMIDIDHFKRFNDLYSHAIGDEMLRHLGAFLQSYVRASDAACRFGGEEFVLILPDSSLETAMERAEFLRQNVQHIQLKDGSQPTEVVTLSIGIAMFPRHGSTGMALLAAADSALYHAKHEGRNRVAVSGD